MREWDMQVQGRRVGGEPGGCHGASVSALEGEGPLVWSPSGTKREPAPQEHRIARLFPDPRPGLTTLSTDRLRPAKALR
jgi:hypothetical protein